MTSLAYPQRLQMTQAASSTLGPALWSLLGVGVSGSFAFYLLHVITLTKLTL